MLPKEKGGVVDPSLKVYGTTNLRVADISIVPIHIGAHPLCTLFHIAEREADISSSTATAFAIGVIGASSSRCQARSG